MRPAVKAAAATSSSDQRPSPHLPSVARSAKSYVVWKGGGQGGKERKRGEAGLSAHGRPWLHWPSVAQHPQQQQQQGQCFRAVFQARDVTSGQIPVHAQV